MSRSAIDTPAIAATGTGIVIENVKGERSRRGSGMTGAGRSGALAMGWRR